MSDQVQTMDEKISEQQRKVASLEFRDVQGAAVSAARFVLIPPLAYQSLYLIN